jgi:hypothetical protein
MIISALALWPYSIARHPTGVGNSPCKDSLSGVAQVAPLA